MLNFAKNFIFTLSVSMMKRFSSLNFHNFSSKKNLFCYFFKLFSYKFHNYFFSSFISKETLFILLKEKVCCLREIYEGSSLPQLQPKQKKNRKWLKSFIKNCFSFICIMQFEASASARIESRDERQWKQSQKGFVFN